MITKQITYKEINDFLTHLGFTETVSENQWRAYRHADSGTLIILADRDGGLAARDTELVSLQRHLVENDLVDDEEIDGFFN
jgi:hypothetical protein